MPAENRRSLLYIEIVPALAGTKREGFSLAATLAPPSVHDEFWMKN